MRGIGVMARAMAPEVLVVALGALDAPEARIAAIEPVLAALTPETAADPASVRLVLALADAMIELGRPEAALGVLSADSLPSEETASRRCMVLVWLGRLDDAMAVANATVEDWMAGFERSARSPHALDTVRIMESMFADALTPAMRDRIASLLREDDASAPDR